MAQRIHSLQALRGMAAGMVVVAHAIEHGPGRSGDPITLTGRFGVDIFFVISGFVIAYVAGTGRFHAPTFLWRRLWRVAPLYWVLTLLVALTALLTPSIYKTTVFATDYLVRSLLFIPAALPGSTDWRPLFKLGWTLNYEMFFYIIMTLMFWCRTMTGRAACLTAVMGLLVALSFVVPPQGNVLAFYANLNLLPFIGGVWLAVVWRRGWFASTHLLAPLAAVAVAVSLTLLFYRLPFFATRGLGGHLLMSGAALAIGGAVLMFERRMFGLRWVEWLGDISYSLYLVHMFVVGAGWAVLNRLGLAPGTPLAWAGIVAMVAGSLITATLSYRLFERPLARLGRQIELGGAIRPANPLPRG